MSVRLSTKRDQDWELGFAEQFYRDFKRDVPASPTKC